jgi:hypothetical protein
LTEAVALAELVEEDEAVEVDEEVDVDELVAVCVREADEDDVAKTGARTRRGR